jgi:hypothetical protein
MHMHISVYAYACIHMYMPMGVSRLTTWGRQEALRRMRERQIDLYWWQVHTGEREHPLTKKL